MGKDWRVSKGESISPPKWLWLVLLLFVIVGSVVWLWRSLAAQTTYLFVLQPATSDTQRIPGCINDFTDVSSQTIKYVPLPQLTLSADLSPLSEYVNSALNKSWARRLGRDNSVVVLFLQANGVTLVDHKVPVLLPSDHELGSSPLIGIESVFEVCRQIKAKHTLLILDTGHVLFDPRLGVLKNDFPTRLAEKVHAQSPMWVLCSNSDYELNQIDYAGRRTIFASNVARALTGKADWNADNEISFLEFCEFVVSRTHEESRGEMTPQLIGPNGVVRFDELEHPESLGFTLTKYKKSDEGDSPAMESSSQPGDIQRESMAKSSAGREPARKSSSSPDKSNSEKSEGESDKPETMLNEEWRDLFNSWREVAQAEDYKSQQWTTIDYTPHVVRRRTNDLVFAQNLLLREESRKDVYKPGTLASVMPDRLQQIQDHTKDWSAELLHRQRIYFRACYFALDFVLLDAGLGTFRNSGEWDSVQSFHSSVNRLVDAMEMSQSKHVENDPTELLSSIESCFTALERVFEDSHQNRHWGVVRCLLESPRLDVRQRGVAYVLLSSPSATLSADVGPPRTDVDRSAHKSPDASLFSRLMSLAIGERATPDEEVVRLYRKYSRDPDAVAGLDEIRRATFLRFVDGRDGQDFVRLSEDVFPTQRTKLVAHDTPSIALSQAKLTFDKIEEPKTVRLVFKGITQNVKLRFSPVDPSIAVTIKNSQDQYDPLKPVEFEVRALAEESQPRNVSVTISAEIAGSRAASATLTVVPPLRGSIALLVDGERPLATNHGNFVKLNVFPNRSTSFTLKVIHTAKEPKSFELTALRLLRPALAEWPTLTLRDLNDDEFATIRDSMVSSAALGTWAAKDVPPNTEAHWRQVPPLTDPGGGSKNEVAANGDARPTMPIEQGILFRIKDSLGYLTEFWGDIHVREPDEYVNIGDVRGLNIQFAVTDGIQIPQFALKKIPIRVRAGDDERQADLFAQKPQESIRLSQVTANVTVDVDGWPRLRRWSIQNGALYDLPSRIAVTRIQPDDKPAREVSAEDLVFGATKKIDVFVELDLNDGFFARVPQTNPSEWRHIEILFDQEEPRKLFSPRSSTMDASFDCERELTLRLDSKVGDHVISGLEIGGAHEKTLIVRASHDPENAYPAQRTRLRFDTSPPIISGLHGGRVVKQGDNVRMWATFSETNPARLSVEIRSGSGEWKFVHQDLSVLNDGPSDTAAFTISSQELTQGSYDVRVTLTDKLDQKSEPFRLDNAFRVEVAKPPPQRKRPQPKKAEPPRGIVTIQLTFDGKPLKSDIFTVIVTRNKERIKRGPTSQGRFQFEVNGANKFEINISGIHAAKRHGEMKELSIMTQADVKEHTIEVRALE